MCSFALSGTILSCYAINQQIYLRYYYNYLYCTYTTSLIKTVFKVTSACFWICVRSSDTFNFDIELDTSDILLLVFNRIHFFIFTLLAFKQNFTTFATGRSKVQEEIILIRHGQITFDIEEENGKVKIQRRHAVTFKEKRRSVLQQIFLNLSLHLHKSELTVAVKEEVRLVVLPPI